MCAKEYKVAWWAIYKEILKLYRIIKLILSSSQKGSACMIWLKEKKKGVNMRWVKRGKLFKSFSFFSLLQQWSATDQQERCKKSVEKVNFLAFASRLHTFKRRHPS